MSNEIWEKATDLFHEALRLSSGERDAFLTTACAGDTKLRAEVESLIAASKSAKSFLEAPVLGELTRERPAWQFESGRRISHYKIVEPIGAGGMGEVYLADDERLGRQVALKVLSEDALKDKNRFQRFEREATAVSALNHPNILTIYDFQLEDELHFFASEFVKGVTLRERLDGGRLSIIESLEIAVQIASALQAAHDAGVIHRDIKPENVMIREDGYVKVLDFGLAKVAEKVSDGQFENARAQSFSLPGMIMGTVTYMSPEQARGSRVDQRSDIFSLAIVIYEMLAGRPPFHGESTTDVLAQIIRVDHRPITELRNDVPPDLERAIDKALKKKASERYQTVAEFCDDLKRALKQVEFSAELKRASDPSKVTTLISDERAVTTARDVSRSYLPTELSPMVGREAEISELTELLIGRGNRLVTLTGIGGTGKTRLAQEMCLRLEDKFADGFIFIRLSDVRDPLLVPAIIAQQARVQEIVGTPIDETLKDFLRDRHSLLVLDNFEQIMDAAPFVAELLSAARNISILVTSRERLHLQAEIEFNVPPLAAPECDETVSLDEIAKFDSVRLFVERARHVDTALELTQENAPAIAKICSMLDGLPLAIELAAARARVFSPSTILERLEARLAFLTGGARDLPERQQTIRATVEWSYELLNDEEKRLFRRLSVFASRFTPATAEAIVSDIPWKPGDASLTSAESIEFLDLFASLADKNLLVRRRSSSGEVAYRLLELVREYAESALEKDDDADQIRRCHAKYFLDLAEHAEPFLQKRQSAIWIERLEEEHDNLRAALRWSLKNEPQIAARLAAAIKQFWSVRGHLNEGIGWAEQILGLGIELPPAIEWKILTLCGNFSQFRGDTKRARQFYEQSLVPARKSGDQKYIAQALRGLGAMAYVEGDLDASRTILEEAIELSQSVGDNFGTAAAMARLGDISNVAGDRKAAIKFASEALAIFRQIGYLEGISSKLYNLGAFVFLDGDHATAGRYFEEAYATANTLKEKINTRLIFDGFAALAAEHGNYKRAARLSGAAESYGTTIGYFMEPGEKVFRDAYIGKLKAAMPTSEFDAEREAGRRMSDEEARRLIMDNDQPRPTITPDADDTDDQVPTSVSLFNNPAVVVVLLILVLIVFGIAALWLLR
jgi:non-specific serine/threonine protein kinase